MDLDLKALVDISSNFTADALAKAKKVYTEGGNSDSYATLTLAVPLVFTVSVGSIILGKNSAGSLVAGVAYEEALAGSTTLNFQYAIEAGILPCSVGGLQSSNTTGCKSYESCTRNHLFSILTQKSILIALGLAASGTLTVGLQTNIGYTYSIATGNKNGRTLQELSTGANVAMRVNGSISNAFYIDFQKVRNAYRYCHTDMTNSSLTIFAHVL